MGANTNWNEGPRDFRQAGDFKPPIPADTRKAVDDEYLHEQ